MKNETIMRLVAACDQDTIRSLLAERDALRELEERKQRDEALPAQAAPSDDWSRAMRLADDAAESVICTVGRSPRERQWVLYPEQIAADPYLADAIAHLEWRGMAKAVREDGRVTVIFEEQP